MSSQSEVMHCYEQVCTLAEQMVLLARSAQWSELPVLEEIYSAMVDRLREIEALESLHEEQIARKYVLLGRIATSQAELSSLVAPQLRRLGEILRNLHQQDRLEKAYGQNSDRSL